MHVVQSVIKMLVKHTNADDLNHRLCTVPVIQLVAHIQIAGIIDRTQSPQDVGDIHRFLNLCISVRR